MSANIRSDSSGTFGAIGFGGSDAITFDATGILTGSYSPKSVSGASLADGALIEDTPSGIGYGAGAGGTVTQSTSKSTGVTVNKPVGQITMNAASLAAGATVSFPVSNSFCAINDLLIVTHATISAEINYSLNYRVGSGFFSVSIKNISAGALAEAVVLNFAIIKGVAA